MSNWTEDDVAKIISNPYHCLPDANGNVMISEDVWIKAATRRIKEDRDRGERFLRELLGHMKTHSG